MCVERRAVLNATPHELRPLRYYRHMLRRRLWKQIPQVGVMPAELLARAVAMFPDPGTQSFDFIHQLRVRHSGQILIHRPSVSQLSNRPSRR